MNIMVYKFFSFQLSKIETFKILLRLIDFYETCDTKKRNANQNKY